MNDVKIKKVRPYPIPVQMVGKAGTLTAQIIKLVMKGFIADMQGKAVNVGDIYQVAFELPVLKVLIQQNAKVIKTYDRTNPATHGIDRLAEFHFVAISDEQQTNILQFLRAIRQRDVS